MFVKATKHKSRARLALMGPSGSGKTYTALAIAQGLGKKIAVIDTEHGSAAKYSDLFSFDVCELHSFSPSDYIQAIRSAADYDVLIIDSISHEWQGKNGCLDLVSQNSSGPTDKNYFAWGKVTPQHNEFVEALLALPAHLIATIRVKMDYAIQINDKGKPSPVKVGLAPVQRDGVEYEFDVLAQIDQEHVLTITKTRYSALDGGVYAKPGKELGEQIGLWLNEGVEDVEKAQAEPASKDDFKELTSFAELNDWSPEDLKMYCIGQWGEDFRKAFTKEMIGKVKVAIIEQASRKEVIA